MRISQSRQKSYACKRRTPEFEEGDHIFLRVILRLGVSLIAFQIALPPFLSNIHSVFHVFQLRKKVHRDPSHVIQFRYKRT
ncbi:hypothetical protein CR513_52576, partial [Mucuna pruriens]